MAVTGGWQTSWWVEIFLWHCAEKYAWHCDCGKPFISSVFKGYQRCCLCSVVIWTLLTVLHPSGLTWLIVW